MKLLLFITILFTVGCKNNIDYEKMRRDEYQNDLNNTAIVHREGCEYLLNTTTYGDVFTHKGNCTNPIHCYNTVK